MGLFSGKKGIIMGVAGERSIATAVARYLYREGAELAFSHLPDTPDDDRMHNRVRDATSELSPKLIHPCDVLDDEHINRFFGQVEKSMGHIDFLVHSIAFAPMDDLRCQTLDVSRKGFKQAIEISAYSLIPIARAASKIMPAGGSIAAMTYLGGERVIPGYNLMGICKAALDTTVKYLAYDLGSKAIRVNGVSAGPVRTLASAAIKDFKKMMNKNAKLAPLGRNITTDEVASSTAYLLSHMASAVTGEIHHVDCGYHMMGSADIEDRQ